MNRGWRRAAAWIMVGSLGWADSGCGQGAARQDDVPPAAAKTTTAGAPRAVHVARAVGAQEDEGFSSSLYVERDVKLAARRSGLIEKVLVDRGQRVRAGQELARLESDLAGRELDMARDEQRLAESEYERLRALKESRIASIQEFQRAEISRDLARSRFEVAKAMLERCSVRAPFEGIVVERWAVPGKRVEETDNTPLFRVIGDEPLRARVDVPERRARGLAVAGAALIATEDSEEPAPARIVFLGPAADAASGTVPVIVEAADRRESLRPGGAVHVRFEGEASASEGPRVRIPRSALPAGSDRAGAEVALFVVEDRKATPRTVRVIEVRGDAAWVAGEVRPDDAVIVRGAEGLSAGSPVEVREGGS